MPDGGKGGIRMAWLPIVVGIVIGYMLYRNKQQNTGTEEDRREYGGRETRRDAERADREAYSSRSIQGDPSESGYFSDEPSYTERSIQGDPRESGYFSERDEKREINEALDAGERALESLRTAKSKLDSARAWGIYDIIGGGMISSMIKHGQISKANEWIQEANYDLRRFAKELRDIPGETLRIDVGDFASMLDIFCDNFFSDIMVQSRINDARRRLDRVIPEVEEAVQALRNRAAHTRGDTRGQSGTCVPPARYRSER